MAKYIVNLLSQPGSPIILVSWGDPVLPNSKENPFSGSEKYTGVEKFLTEIAVYLGNGTR